MYVKTVQFIHNSYNGISTEKSTYMGDPNLNLQPNVQNHLFRQTAIDSKSFRGLGDLLVG